MAYVLGLVGLSLIALVSAGIYVDTIRDMEHNTRAAACVSKNAIYVQKVSYFDKSGKHYKEFMCIHAQEVK